MLIELHIFGLHNIVLHLLQENCIIEPDNVILALLQRIDKYLDENPLHIRLQRVKLIANRR